jgi:uncharacterized protein (TIGR03437 family)
MRFALFLSFLNFCAAQTLAPGVAIRKIVVDASGSIYAAQGSSVTKLNQWTVTVSGTVLGLSWAPSGSLAVGGAGSIVSLDPGSGKVLSSLSFTLPNNTTAESMTITPAGNIIVSGGASVAVTATAGALSVPGGGGLLMKFDPTGKLLWTAIGIGGAVTADAQENIYVAGNGSNAKVPTTANAFQATAPFNVCETTGGLISFGFACSQQYIAKVSPDGTTLLFATYLTGALGANPEDIALGPDGSIYTAGSVQATDYPVTGGALIGTFPAKYVDTRCNCIVPATSYAASGFVSRMSADGTKLLYSTYLGGSEADTVKTIAVGTDGTMTVGGMSMSPDFPGLPAQLDNCRPGISLVHSKEREFLIHLSADGSTIESAQLIGGTNPGVGIACITDAADGVFADTVSPGELITINGLGVGPAASETPGFSVAPPQIGGVSVTFDGIPAVLTAAGGTIVTASVPFAVAGKQQTTLTLLQNGQAIDSRQLNIAATTPATFLLPPNGKTCDLPPMVNYGALTGGSPAPAPLILNADGTINACDNPAASGSVITFFMNGLGVGTPQLTAAGGELKVIAVGPMEGVTAVSSVSIAVPKGITNPFYFTVMEGSTPGRDAIPIYLK